MSHHRYREVPARDVAFWRKRAAELSIERAAQYVGADPVPVKWYVPAGDGPADWVDETDTLGQLGVGKVWLRADQSYRTTSETAAHEFAHVIQYRALGDRYADEADHREAEAEHFGLALTEQALGIISVAEDDE